MSRPRNTVWITDTVWRAVMHIAIEVSGSSTKMMERTAKEVVTETLRDHLEAMTTLPPGERPCYVGTLIRYPGRSVNESRYDPTTRLTKQHEALHPGSMRLHMTLDDDMFDQAVAYGLLLPYQWNATAPGVDPDQEVTSSRIAAHRGRPLSDSVLTALTLRFGTTTAGPMTNIPEQIITHQTARNLWAVAEQARPVEHTIAALNTCLPQLLGSQTAAEKTAQLLTAGWDGTIENLTNTVTQPSRPHEPNERHGHPTLF